MGGINLPLLGENINKTAVQIEANWDTFLKTAAPGLYFYTFTNLPSWLSYSSSSYLYIEVTYQGNTNWFFRIFAITTNDAPEFFVVYSRVNDTIKKVYSTQRNVISI